MTRRGSSAPGMRPARALGVLLFLTILVAACGGSTPTATPSNVPATDAPASGAPATGTTATPGQPTVEPATLEPATAEPSMAQPATEEPTGEPESTQAAGDGAAACTGTDENLAFFAEFAQVVDWPVYCAVLPKGWFVGTGQWRQADGGRLEISYRGPSGAGLMLQEGAFCPEPGDCVPAGDDLGATAFGDREGTLIRTADGWAVVLDRGEKPSWLLTLAGVSETAARKIAEDLATVGG